jgi:hypothetical protein
MGAIAAVHLVRLSHDQARREADAVLRAVPPELRSTPVQGEPGRWMADPVGLRDLRDSGTRLIALQTGTPSLRLLADQTAEVLAGISLGHLLSPPGSNSKKPSRGSHRGSREWPGSRERLPPKVGIHPQLPFASNR